MSLFVQIQDNIVYKIIDIHKVSNIYFNSKSKNLT